jgi:hypothetical protein
MLTGRDKKQSSSLVNRNGTEPKEKVGIPALTNRAERERANHADVAYVRTRMYSMLCKNIFAYL